MLKTRQITRSVVLLLRLCLFKSSGVEGGGGALAPPARQNFGRFHIIWAILRQNFGQFYIHKTVSISVKTSFSLEITFNWTEKPSRYQLRPFFFFEIILIGAGQKFGAPQIILSSYAHAYA